MSDIKIRDIVESDIENGFLESLDSLTPASNLDRKTALDILKRIIDNPDHIIHIAEIDGKIVGSTTLGRGIGMKLVVSLLEKAEAMNCYKTILDCKKELIPFYERIGFKQESNQMRYNH